MIFYKATCACYFLEFLFIPYSYTIPVFLIFKVLFVHVFYAINIIIVFHKINLVLYRVTNIHDLELGNKCRLSEDSGAEIKRNKV